MANRYWVGGTGNWSDTSHWSTSSGGSGGASVPSSNDVDVFIDENSGLSEGTINLPYDYLRRPRFHNFTSTTGYSYAIVSNEYERLRCHGSFVGESGLSFSTEQGYVQNLSFYGTPSESEQTITLNGAIFPETSITIASDGTSSSYRLVGDTICRYFGVHMGSMVLHGNLECKGFGCTTEFFDTTFNANGFNITSGLFDFGADFYGDGVLTVNMGNGLWEMSEENEDGSFWGFWGAMEERSIWDTGDSIVRFTAPNGGIGYPDSSGFHYEFNNLQLSSAVESVSVIGGSVISVNNFIASGSAGNLITLQGVEGGGVVESVGIANGGSNYQVGDYVSVNGGKEDFSCWLEVVSVGAGGSVTGVSINSPGLGYVTTNGVGTTNDEGDGGGLTVNIVASEITSQFALSKSSGIVECDYLNLTNSTATGGATWYAGSHSIDNGGNGGWIFEDAPPPLDVTVDVEPDETVLSSSVVSVIEGTGVSPSANVDTTVFTNPNVSVVGKAVVATNVDTTVFTNPNVSVVGKAVVATNVDTTVFTNPNVSVITTENIIIDLNTNEIVFTNPSVDVAVQANIIIDVSANETNLNSLGVNITEGEGISFDTSTDQAVFTNLAIKAVEQGGGYSPLASILNFISPEITVETEYNWYFPNKANSKWKKLEAVQTEWTKNSKIKTNWKKI